MKEIISTITSKGQVTIPAEVRKHLGLNKRDKIAFVIDEEGDVHLKAPHYPTVASLRGAAAATQPSHPHGTLGHNRGTRTAGAQHSGPSQHVRIHGGTVG